MSLRTIKERVEAATPGPWAIARYQHGGGRVATSFDHADRELVADLYHEGDREFLYAARTDVPALLRVAEAVAMMPTPVELNGCCTFCDAVMDVDQMTDDGHWPHEVDCPLGMAHRSLADLEALP